MTGTTVHQKLSGLLIVVGSLVFVCGGAFHPKINSSIGALGSVEFFQNFYMHIAHHGSWRLIHGLILAGPVLWLLGIGSHWSGRNGWTRMATTAMTLAATAWSVTFVFDGFVAPDIVRWLTPETGWYMLAVNQDVVIRLGLVSWLMLGFAMIAGSLGIILSRPSRDAKILAWIGALLGAWSFIAWTTGMFLPGPFTSPYWNATAVSTAFWFLAVGVSLLLFCAVTGWHGGRRLANSLQVQLWVNLDWPKLQHILVSGSESQRRRQSHQARLEPASELSVRLAPGPRVEICLSGKDGALAPASST